MDSPRVARTASRWMYTCRVRSSAYQYKSPRRRHPPRGTSPCWSRYALLYSRTSNRHRSAPRSRHRRCTDRCHTHCCWSRASRVCSRTPRARHSTVRRHRCWGLYPRRRGRSGPYDRTGNRSRTPETHSTRRPGTCRSRTARPHRTRHRAPARRQVWCPRSACLLSRRSSRSPTARAGLGPPPMAR